MNTNTDSRPRKPSSLHHSVTTALVLHFLCLAGIQFYGSNFAIIYQDFFADDAQMPVLTRFFIASPNLILLFVSALLVIWAVVFVYKNPSRKRSIILLTTLVVYTLLLATLAIIALFRPLLGLSTHMAP